MVKTMGTGIYKKPITAFNDTDFTNSYHTLPLCFDFLSEFCAIRIFVYVHNIYFL